MSKFDQLNEKIIVLTAGLQSMIPLVLLGGGNCQTGAV